VIIAQTEVLADRILNIFACSSTTKSQGNKRLLPFNPACLKGVDILFHGIFIVLGRDTDGGELVQSESLLPEY